MEQRKSMITEAGRKGEVTNLQLAQIDKDAIYKTTLEKGLVPVGSANRSRLLFALQCC